MLTSSHRQDDLVISVSAQLTGEFAATAGAEEVGLVVRQALRDLRGRVDSEAFGELLHRVAHHRLTRLAAARSGGE